MTDNYAHFMDEETDAPGREKPGWRPFPAGFQGSARLGHYGVSGNKQ